MNTPLQTIQLLVAPVVMISANGLICLALYNRLAAIVSRARAFHKEQFDALTELSAMGLDEQGSLKARQLRTRVEGLGQQVGRILRRGRYLRNALMALQAAVLAMLLCSLALGLTTVVAGIESLPLILFILGVLAMAGGTVLAMRELREALEPVTAESDLVMEEREE